MVVKQHLRKLVVLMLLLFFCCAHFSEQLAGAEPVGKDPLNCDQPPEISL
uniref:Uncharacterized protein n=1 Tax=Arundo donax TaxID=35708 RepID=A0A0A9HE64_ARUDO